MLFLQGTRDTLAMLDQLKPLCESLGERATLKLFEDADHSFHVPARTGRKDSQVWSDMSDTIRRLDRRRRQAAEADSGRQQRWSASVKPKSWAIICRACLCRLLVIPKIFSRGVRLTDFIVQCEHDPSEPPNRQRRLTWALGTSKRFAGPKLPHVPLTFC